MDKGELGNAPDDTKVPGVEIWAEDLKNPAVKLVESFLGEDAKLVRREPPLPGVNVVVGEKFPGVRGGSGVGRRQGGRHHLQPPDRGSVGAYSSSHWARRPPRADLPQPLLGPLPLLARGDDEQVVAVAQDRTAFGHQGLALADHHRHRRPAGQPQLTDLDAVQLGDRADRDLQQVGRDPFERGDLEIEVARLGATGHLQHPGDHRQRRAGQQRCR